MKKITRLTMNELSRIVENSVNRVVKESVDYDREIRLAQKELVKVGNALSSIGMRLEGTPYSQQYKLIFHELSKLNSALIKHLKGGKK